jgi:heme/copper-type cytochrome/quinol oxidase subunit 1
VTRRRHAYRSAKFSLDPRFLRLKRLLNLKADDSDRSKNPTLCCPLHFVTGFIFIVILHSLTGATLAAIPADLQQHDTYFVVAHLQYPLIAGAAFPLFGAVYYWLPKISRRMLDESLGRLNFWLLFIGYNLTFFPIGVLGTPGATRRVNTYTTRTEWETSGVLSMVGAILMGFRVLVFVINLFVSRAKQKISASKRYGALLTTSTSSEGSKKAPADHRAQQMPYPISSRLMVICLKYRAVANVLSNPLGAGSVQDRA